MKIMHINAVTSLIVNFQEMARTLNVHVDVLDMVIDAKDYIGMAKQSAKDGESVYLHLEVQQVVSALKLVIGRSRHIVATESFEVRGYTFNSDVATYAALEAMAAVIIGTIEKNM